MSDFGRLSHFRLNPPSEFSFEPREWREWKAHFIRYRKITGLELLSQKDQTEILLYIMGPKVENVYKTFWQRDTSTYDNLISLFDEYFLSLS